MNVAHPKPKLRGLAGAILAVASALVLLTAAAPAPVRIIPTVPNEALVSIPVVADSALMKELQHGGYVIVFRHAMTNWNERDAAEGNFSDRSHQRNLSQAGQKQAAVIGVSIKALKIPIAKVLASPMWRCRDTAQLAFGEYDTTSLLFWKGPSFREERSPYIQESTVDWADPNDFFQAVSRWVRRMASR